MSRMNSDLKKCFRGGIAAAVLVGAVFGVNGQDAGSADGAKVEKTPKRVWKRSVAAGLTLAKGNSDNVLVTMNGLATTKWDKNELSLGIDAARGENSGTLNTETLSGHVQYNRLISERAFGLMRTEALHDTIADVELRLTLSPGLGYYLIKQEKRNLSFELGPSFVYDKLGSSENSYMALRVGERFETAISERARLWQTLEWLPQVDDFNNYLLKAELGVEADLTKKLSLRVTMQDIYDNEPAAGRKSNDIRLVSGIAYKF